MYKVALLIALLGCSNDKKSPSGSDDSAAKLSAYKTQMCACKDAACATAVNDAMTKWSREKILSDDGSRKTATADSVQAQAQLIEDIGKCQAAVK